jgi:hypothetical protein
MIKLEDMSINTGNSEMWSSSAVDPNSRQFGKEVFEMQRLRLSRHVSASKIG